MENFFSERASLSRWIFDSFGRLKLNKGESGSCPFRYHGQYEDVETGLYYNRFRYYSPEEGLYISQDPIGLEGGDRFYGYVDDPNSFIDLFGLTQKTYKVEASLSNNPRKTHGHQWNEADAKKRANDTENLQGKFGSKEDANYAVQQAQNLQIGERKVIPAQAGNSNVLIDKNGNKQPASHIFIEVKPSGNTGTIHAFPVDENYKVTPRPGFTI